MKILTTVFFIFFLIGCSDSNDPIVPSNEITDIVVSDENAQLGDVEVDPFKQRISWQTIDDNKLWVCNIDPITGKLAVGNGKQTLIDDIIPLSTSFNSGEWSFSKAGTAIVYGKVGAGGTKYVAIAKENTAGWTITTLDTSPDRFNPRATKNPNDDVAAVQYVTFPGTSTTKYKFFNDTNTEFSIANFSDAHWADDEQVLTGILPNGQVGLFDPANPATPIQITSNTSVVYSRPYMWRAPDQNNARMFFAKANGNEIQVFKESSANNNVYLLFSSFKSPSTNTAYINIGSPEPVVFKDKSYITFMTSLSPLETSGEPADIWYAYVGNSTPTFKKVSDDAVRVRTDPEPYPTASTLYIYYTEVDDSATPDKALDVTTILKLRRCETGL